jgi:hypothetical protein
MNDISVCSSANDLGFVIHWDTYSDTALDSDLAEREGAVSVNPLSWEHNGGLARSTQHQGAVPIAGSLNLKVGAEDLPQGIEFAALGTPMPGILAAQCKGGVLFVSDQETINLVSRLAFFPAAAITCWIILCFIWI